MKKRDIVLISNYVTVGTVAGCGSSKSDVQVKKQMFRVLRVMTKRIPERK